MGTPDILNSKAVKRFVKSTFVILGLVVVLFYGLATLILFFGDKLGCNNYVLIWFVTIFPIIFLIGFLGLVELYYKKLHSVSSINYEESLRKTIKMDTMGEAYLLTANAIRSARTAGKDVDALEVLLKTLLEEHSKICPVEK